MYPRKLTPLIRQLLGEFRIVYLTGPRQAGKTTLARTLAEEIGMDFLTLDQQAVLASAQQDPHGLIQSLAHKNVVLDEFQYAPALVSAIKAASDQLSPDEKGKFLLTGSADIFRSAKAQEALPGHMARLELYPLSIAEIYSQEENLVDFLLAGDFKARSTGVLPRDQLAHWILSGGYPEIQSKSPRARQFWFNSYTEGRLFKDFETLYAARGDYHSRLKALLPFLAGLCGNLIKYANIANDLSLDDKLVKSYLEILELMFIVQRLPAWLKNAAKRQATTLPKLHFVDTGLACHLLGLRTPQQLLASQFYGGLLKNFLYLECHKQSGWAQEQVKLYHFRDKRKNEVDVVLEQSNGDIIGMEVKASSKIDARDFKGLNILAECAGEKFRHGVLFYNGQEVLPFSQGKQKFYALPIGMLATGKP